MVRSATDLRDAGAVGQRLVVVAVADLVVGDADRDHHVVVVAVVGAEDLDDRVAAGGRAGDPDRVHRRLGAGVRVAPPRAGPSGASAPRATTTPSSVGRGEVRARAGSAPRPPCRSPGGRGPAPSSRSRCGSRAARSRRRPRPWRPGRRVEVDRPRVAHLVRGGDAAGEGLAGALVHGPRGLGCARRAVLSSRSASSLIRSRSISTTVASVAIGALLLGLCGCLGLLGRLLGGGWLRLPAAAESRGRAARPDGRWSVTAAPCS